ncbi:MAG TPA: hypothetical protein VG984_00975 [Candidatus Paceibacterota bacterium]|nr:hypothetical protein [Candidatus Paceibacterota bacterium]
MRTFHITLAVLAPNGTLSVLQNVRAFEDNGDIEAAVNKMGEGFSSLRDKKEVVMAKCCITAIRPNHRGYPISHAAVDNDGILIHQELLDGHGQPNQKMLEGHADWLFRDKSPHVVCSAAMEHRI